jgi:dTDP-4-dehydrorhamnose 3,5-epimerase
MEFVATALPGVVELRPVVVRDWRGTFAKTFHRDLFAAHGLRTDFVEEYYSVSHARVLRGLHFQLPPHDHAKLVYCAEGSVLDVALDLRVGSPTFGEHVRRELDAVAGLCLYLPPGLAHGFYVLQAPAIMVYNQTSVYVHSHDAGVRWDSAGIAWPDADPVLSDRDRDFPALADFRSPFTFTPAAR